MTPHDAYESMVNLVHRVRTPAGDDPRFSSFNAIKLNFSDFLVAAHKGMAQLHSEAVHSIMETQEQVIKLDRGSEEAQNLLLFQMLWYHVNNNLAWLGLKHERHVVRRMCGFKPRPRLSQANPDAVFRMIEEINADPMKFAMWADATSFIDSGDILVIDPSKSSHQLLEVKQRADEIWTFTSNTPKEQIRQFQAGIEGEPKQAESKTQRLRRQLSRTRKIEEVIKNDVGTDPFLNLPVFVSDSQISERYFHKEMELLLTDARKNGYALEMIDDCLWVGAYYDHAPHYRLAFAASAAGEFSDGSEMHFKEIADRAVLETQIYTQRASHWLALPIFSFDIPDEDVLHLISGIAKVRMYFHWEAWGKLLEKLGGSFRWISEREYKGIDEYKLANQPDVFSNRIPYVTFDEVSFVPASTHMIRIFTDMLRPSTLAELAFHQSQIVKSRG